MTAVWFDLDGTLLSFDRPYPDLLEAAFESVVGAAADPWLVAYDEAVRDRLDRCAPEPIRRSFGVAIDEFDLDADPEALATALLEREASEASPPPGADEALADLAGEYSLGVLTNGPTEWQRTKLERNGLADRFDHVVTSYEAGAPKPDPAPYRLAEERLPAERSLMVGDSAADVEGAEAAGWAALRFEGESFEEVPAAVREAFAEK